MGICPKKSGRYSKFSGGLLFTHGSAQTAFVRAVTPRSYLLHPRVYYELTIDQLTVGLIAQLVRALYWFAEVMGSILVQA